MSDRIPHYLLGMYVLLFVACAIDPWDRAVWFAENLPIVLIVGLLVGLWRWHRFSSLAYLLMAFLIFMHTIGGHYTFERVPFGVVTEFFGFERNHYDRIAHFTVGFYAYAIAELLLVRQLVRSAWVLTLFPIFSIVTVAAGYEVIEWLFAISADPSAGIAVLGSQGDIWDAQKDMVADALGAILAVSVFYLRYRREIGMLKQLNPSN